MTDPSAAPLPAVFEQLRASPEGLSGEEARRRLAEVGPNEPVGRRRGAALVEVLALLANPLVVISCRCCRTNRAGRTGGLR